MPSTLAGFPFWPFEFGASGTPFFDAGAAIAGVAAAGVANLFVFAHGWNSDPAMAMDLFTRFFGEFRTVLGERSTARIGVAGVFWPSLLFPDAVSVSDECGGGAAATSDWFAKPWDAAKNALRCATYWEMKSRAGVVGKAGLGPLLAGIRAAAPAMRVHLIGHSFGARLVSCALAGLPDALTGTASPVKSLFLIQGAFSHFAFAEALPFDRARKGELAGMAKRVDGPLLTTFSSKDLAVGHAYPIASVLAGQDAAAARDLMYRWQGMGHDGAQAVDAAVALLGPAGMKYPFRPGEWLNLDANHVIVNGAPPSGAHGDIVHPEIAWAALAAAGIA